MGAVNPGTAAIAHPGTAAIAGTRDTEAAADVPIDILCANLSSNAYGRAYMLAHLLAPRHPVRVLGVTFGRGLWPPCDDGSLDVTARRGSRLPRFAATFRDLARLATAPVLLAVKPRPSSFGVALWARRRTHAAVVLDIDDWDLAGVYGLGEVAQRLREIATLADPYSNLYLRLLGRRAGSADAVTVASPPLRALFGGTLVPHVRDTAALDPARFDRGACRAELGIGAEPAVVFLGTPRPHKGLEELAAAVGRLGDIGARLVIVGAEPGDAYAARLAGIGGAAVTLLPPRPWDRIGPTLVAADAVALPQRDLPFAHAQIPAKLFDAMALARPIVATAVGWMPEVLDGCGIIVPPGDVEALAAALRGVLTDPRRAATLGAAARARCVARFSWDAARPVLEGVVAEALARRRRRRGSPGAAA